MVREGAVIGMGVFIGQSTKIVDRETGEVFMYGEVPRLFGGGVAGSLSGKNLPDRNYGPSLYCAVIVKKRGRAGPAPRPRSTSCLGTDPHRPAPARCLRCIKPPPGVAMVSLFCRNAE